MKLYRVTCKGMTTDVLGTSHAWGHPYVLAEDPTEAEEIVKTFLDKRDYGFGKERVVEKIELLAEVVDKDNQYPKFSWLLYTKESIEDDT